MQQEVHDEREQRRNKVDVGRDIEAVGRELAEHSLGNYAGNHEENADTGEYRRAGDCGDVQGSHGSAGDEVGKDSQQCAHCHAYARPERDYGSELFVHGILLFI